MKIHFLDSIRLLFADTGRHFVESRRTMYVQEKPCQFSTRFSYYTVFYVHVLSYVVVNLRVVCLRAIVPEG